jgi:hypothetical protein
VALRSHPPDRDEERQRADQRGGKKLRSRTGLTERFLYRLAAHHRIVNVERLKQRIPISALRRWIAAYRVEPFGDEWGRTALQTLLILKALGAQVDPQFREMFLPSYDPDREMTEDEIQAELMKCSGARFVPKSDAKDTLS